MTNKEKLLSAIDNYNNDNMDIALLVIRKVCNISVVDCMRFDTDTLLDMGYGTIEAMEEIECSSVVRYFNNRNITL